MKNSGGKASSFDIPNTRVERENTPGNHGSCYFAGEGYNFWHSCCEALSASTNVGNLADMPNYAPSFLRADHPNAISLHAAAELHSFLREPRIVDLARSLDGHSVVRRGSASGLSDGAQVRRHHGEDSWR